MRCRKQALHQKLGKKALAALLLGQELQIDLRLPAHQPVHQAGVNIGGIFLLQIVVVGVVTVQGYLVRRHAVKAANLFFLKVPRL